MLRVPDCIRGSDREVKMLLDAMARKILAQEILDEALAQRKAAGDDFEIVHMPDGALSVPYEVGRTEPRLGFVYCHYLPIGAVEELLVACEHIIDGSTVTVMDDDGSMTRKSLTSLAEEPAELIQHVRSMALFAIRFLLDNFENRVHDALRENFEDSLEYVAAALMSNFVNHFGGPAEFNKLDARGRIESLAKSSADKRRHRLNALLKHLPGLQILNEGEGRPRRDEWDKAAVSARVKTEILEAVCALRGEREKVTKANVARRLGLGSEKNRTQALKNKLSQANVSWEALLASANEHCPESQNSTN
jgi:hypothetical protein